MTPAAMLAAWLAAGPGEPAPTGSVEFRWDAPTEHCPSEAEVLAQLERLLGGQVSAQGDRRLTAIARVRRETDGRWDLRLWTVTQEETSERSMSGSDCVVLAEAAALLAAMAIDPSALTRGEASPAAVEHYYYDSPDVDPQGPDNGSTRVLRGYCVFSQMYGPYCHATWRDGNPPLAYSSLYGFRCAQDPAPRRQQS
jgi:hypothetical protein